MRPNTVEIKLTVDGPRVPAAMRALALEPDDGQDLKIYFCEDTADGLAPGTPLLDAGVVLRVRDTGDRRSDSTIKLRPCRRSQLNDYWLGATDGDGWEFKLEADWAGPRKVLAASCTARRSPERIEAVHAGNRSIKGLFTDKQERFLRTCAGLHVNLRTLRLLPPVAATRWGPLELDASGTKLTALAERWVVDDALDFLELSLRVSPESASAAQASLAELVRGHGVESDPGQESKTRRVLRHLVTAVP
ncbi:hypothetical protein [Nonomuraea sp. SBT364]|uniref:hypothetical protein n=1 Tax=Nonomuraea sp. SBT364 TaxID=1580530 RepID=UPI0007C74B73|nr:hypothetical protein [Nonomuraea sp. SBT364]